MPFSKDWILFLLTVTSQSGGISKVVSSIRQIGNDSLSDFVGDLIAATFFLSKFL